MFMTFDPLWLLFVSPAILLAMWAQWRVKSAYHAASQIRSLSGMTGAQAARELLDLHGLHEVQIEDAHGMLSDHYDPKARVLRLSHDVAHGNTLASLGIAAHEAGHAIQDAQHYGPLVIRNGLVPMAIVGSNLSMVLLVVGMVMMFLMGSPLGWWVAVAGVGLFGVTVVFQLVNLPVEFDASRRAKIALVQYGMVAEQEMPAVRRVLSAAALTYVAATLMAVLQLLYFLFRLGLLGGRDE